MLVYPQLPPPVSAQLVQKRRSLPVLDLAKLAAPDHVEQIFSPVGTPAEASHLRSLRSHLLQGAQESGYPNAPDQVQRLRFDAYAGRVLHYAMNPIPAEASKGGVWEFMSLVLVPDLVRWRWFDASMGLAPTERFLAGRRNTFERAWRRAFLLYDESRTNPYELIDELGEDELVQIVERPYLSGNRQLARLMGSEFLASLSRNSVNRRREHMRDAQKRFMRLASFVCFDGLHEKELGNLLRLTYDLVAAASNSTDSAETHVFP
jgi:hypothetical protein